MTVHSSALLYESERAEGLLAGGGRRKDFSPSGTTGSLRLNQSRGRDFGNPRRQGLYAGGGRRRDLRLRHPVPIWVLTHCVRSGSAKARGLTRSGL